ncbi:TPA: hypothetical protein EYO57_28610 [Candidatus Poribacteria bacterium]|nr:hypothetical protein [Candidatus Poribacteria bacterium]
MARPAELYRRARRGTMDHQLGFEVFDNSPGDLSVMLNQNNVPTMSEEMLTEITEDLAGLTLQTMGTNQPALIKVVQEVVQDLIENVEQMSGLWQDNYIRHGNNAGIIDEHAAEWIENQPLHASAELLRGEAIQSTVPEKVTAMILAVGETMRQLFKKKHPIVVYVMGLSWLWWSPAIVIGTLFGASVWQTFDLKDIWKQIWDSLENAEIDPDQGMFGKKDITGEFLVASAGWIGWNYVAPVAMKHVLKSRLGEYSLDVAYVLTAPILGSIYEMFLFPILDPSTKLSGTYKMSQNMLYEHVFERRDNLDPVEHQRLMKKWLWDFLPSPNEIQVYDFWWWSKTNLGYLPILAKAGLATGLAYGTAAYSSRAAEVHLGIQYLISQLNPYALLTPMSDSWEWTVLTTSKMPVAASVFSAELYNDVGNWMYKKVVNVVKSGISSYVSSSTTGAAGMLPVIAAVLGIAWYLANWKKM